MRFFWSSVIAVLGVGAYLFASNRGWIETLLNPSHQPPGQETTSDGWVVEYVDGDGNPISQSRSGKSTPSGGPKRKFLLLCAFPTSVGSTLRGCHTELEYDVRTSSM